MELLAGVPVCCKIASKGFEMPCKIRFSYKNGGNVVAFISCFHKEPTFSNSEKKCLGRPLCLQIKNTAQKTSKGASRQELNAFQNPFVYMSLESTKGVLFTIQASFGYEVSRVSAPEKPLE